MPKLFYALITLLFIDSNLYSQSFEKLKISSEELPKEYTLTKEMQCQAVQACSFYKQTDMYSAFLGKVKLQDVQNFESKNDNGSIMYFEFEKDFKGEGFVKGLLWGQSDKPTKEHPEEFIVSGKILIIYSFQKDSEIKKLSQSKVKLLLK